jgi:hypothetical protein
MPKRLLPLKPFTWYGIDADYDVARGRYDLRIFEEGFEQPVLSLHDQANATSHAGSAVSMFSFIGDNGDDLSNVNYWVDDVVVATDRDLVLPPFVAPGRRKLFIETEKAPLLPPAPTLEHQGDEAFERRDFPAARRFYEEALVAAVDRARLLLKLSDVCHLLGDVESERKLRETIFGTLRP